MVRSNSKVTRSGFYTNQYLEVSHVITVFICIALLWKLWALPRDFPFPLSYINVIGLNKISLGLVLLYVLNRLIKHESLSIQFPQLKWLLLFLAGIGVSIIYNSSGIGIQRLLSVQSGNLNYQQTIVGIGFYIIFFYFFSYKNVMDRFLTICVVIAFIFYFLMILGFCDEFVGLFGSGPLYYVEEGKYAYETTAKLTRGGFPTMDDNTFGPIASAFLIIGLYKYLTLRIWQKQYKIFLILFYILSVVVMLKTISRSTVLVGIVQVGIFILLSSKYKIKPVFLSVIGFAVLWLMFSAGMLPGSNYIISLYERFAEIAYNITYYTDTFQHTDNYHARILLALASLPTDTAGWIFGTGGVYVGFVKGIPSYSHIDFTNWISQYGLITVIPLLIYFFSMIFYLLRWDEARIKVEMTPAEKKDLFFIRNLGISLSAGILIVWLNSPLFFMFWFILGITTSIIIILRKVEKPQKVVR